MNIATNTISSFPIPIGVNRTLILKLRILLKTFLNFFIQVISEFILPLYVM